MFSLLRSSSRAGTRALARPAFATSSSARASQQPSSDADTLVPSSPETPAASSSSSSSSIDPAHEQYYSPSGQLLPPSLLPRLPTPKPSPPERLNRDVKEEVDPDHPLWAFFHKDPNNPGQVRTIERISKDDANSPIFSGRPFEAAELRLKSFHELHTLWYLLLREKNVYYTQMAEAARRGVHASVIKRMGTQTQRAKIQTSMARIKYVLNERNLAYKAVQQAEVDRQSQEDHLAALYDELALAETGESAVDPSTQTVFEADIIAGRELPEPIQVRKFREEMRVASGRRGRTAERKARLPKRSDAEDVFKRLPGNAQRAEIAQKNREAVKEKEQAL